MNKLTTIKTIKKAAPLALLAVVMSGSAFANPGKGKGPKDKDQPQASISVHTSCSLCDPTVEGYDPANYVNCDYNKENPTFYVVAEITDETGDLDYGVELTPALSVDATLLRKDTGGKDTWYQVSKTESYSAYPGQWSTELKPCELDSSISDHPGGAKAITALVNVVVTNPANASKSVYASKCENFDPYPETEEIDEDYIDQSDFDVKPLGISCNVPQ